MCQIAIRRRQSLTVRRDQAETALDRLTLAMIAQRLGVALPSLYKHVRGLDALLQKLSALATAELAADLSAAAAGRARLDAVRAEYDPEGRFHAWMGRP